MARAHGTERPRLGDREARHGHLGSVTQGAIESVRFEADVIGHANSNVSSTKSFAFRLIQDGELYLAFVDFDHVAWAPIATLELGEADFTHTIDPGLSLDFSATGAPIRFGAGVFLEFS